jgi:cellulose synthase/poly-beta-1,6-N-acetylglucosamine synthase-like glycosyltransferase
MEVNTGVYILIAILSLLNFARIFTMLIGSDIYDVRAIKASRGNKRAYNPKISVIIPAYNEEVGVLRTVISVLANDYRNKQVIVVDDGSKDNTYKVLRNYQKQHPRTFHIVRQKNAGKAAAINNAIANVATGSLIMVLDADSLIAPDGLRKMTAHFRNRYVLAAASNVKIINTRTLLGYAQRFEYLISYRMKRSLSVLNMEYIIGGVGSTFRKRALMAVGLYDTDTMTEDIDLTVKIIRHYGNRKYRIHYAADCLTFTEHVASFKSLVKQRYRWKYGRFQTLIKNKNMMYNRSRLYDYKLTWYQLPYALFGELVLLIEPLLVGYILYVSIAYADIVSLLSVYAIVTSFILLVLIGDPSETFKTKVNLSVFLPATYFVLYILTVVEFIALAKSIKGIKPLIKRIDVKSSWEHVERLGGAVAVQELLIPAKPTAPVTIPNKIKIDL